MFWRNEKVQSKPAKQHSAAFWMIWIFTLAIELMLGINAAFLLDQSLLIVANNMLADTPLAPLGGLIALIVALLAGLAVVLGGIWTFTSFIDSLDSANAYHEHYGSKVPWATVLVCVLEGAIIGIDFTTLCFRATYFAERGAIWLFIFFIILIILPPILGPLLHVLENAPRDRRLALAYRQAEQLEATDLASAIEAMDPDLRTRYLNGDQDAISEHYERARTREENYQYEQQQIAARRSGKQQQKYHPPTNTTRPLEQASLAQTHQTNQRS